MKALVLSLLLGLVCHAASEVYTWDFSTNGPFLGGSIPISDLRSITIENVKINGIATRALIYPTTYCEEDTSVLYDMLECAALGKELRFTMDVYWDGTQSTTWQTFLHVGAESMGITLGMNPYGQLTFADKNNYDEDLIAAAQLEVNTWNAVSFTLCGDKTYITIGNTTYQGNDLTWEDMAWDGISNEEHKYHYTLGCRASGNYHDARIKKGVKIANLKVELIPEPATVSLSLLAITCLITRRRRD